MGHLNLLFLAVAAFAFASCNGQNVLPATQEQYISAVKCSFVIPGEFTYDQAVKA